ncbi:hypothetical protein RSOLAG22IIIB_03020 [Rhizoctonia solani]|uniref:Ribosomal protein L9 domain-containing protein n=1 Tax=Rhizoctonia solani TaxID=456999 RepID=A0A0K6FMA9_9AGAM|nr:hypothetical protein RSOLAG22IIIB_03020 [Rhizoctonia solani]
MSRVLNSSRIVCTGANISLPVPRQIPALFARHVHKHRTIEVQLTADVPGLGAFGSVQTVNPGRMRNQLYPMGLAAYIRRGAAPKLLERPRDPNAPLIPDIDFAELELSLRELPNLVFRRRAMKNASSSQQTTAPLNSRAIYGSVTPADVLQRLSDSHHLTLLPPNALLEFNDRSSKLRSTGNHGATVNLRNGTKVPLSIAIEGDD